MTHGGRVSWVVAGLVAGLLLAPGPADARKGNAGKAEEVRAYLDKATAAFALNRYAAAAENYEKAFELKPDPAVLYNAAQAYRLAGNKERALELYQSYLRMYGTEKRAEIEAHIENLKQAIEKDRAVATSPPTTPAPVGTTVPTPAPPPAPEPVAAPRAEPPPPAAAVALPPPAPEPKPVEPAPVLVAQTAPPRDGGSVLSKPWFWLVIGGVIVGAAVTGFLFTRGGPSDPTASLGQPVNGNGN